MTELSEAVLANADNYLRNEATRARGLIALTEAVGNLRGLKRAAKEAQERLNALQAEERNTEGRIEQAKIAAAAQIEADQKAAAKEQDETRRTNALRIQRAEQAAAAHEKEAEEKAAAIVKDAEAMAEKIIGATKATAKARLDELECEAHKKSTAIMNAQDELTGLEDMIGMKKAHHEQLSSAVGTLTETRDQIASEIEALKARVFGG